MNANPYELPSFSEFDSSIDPQLLTTISLRKQAEGHVRRPGSVFTLIDRPEGYCQDFSEVYFPPQANASLQEINDFCVGIIGPYFGRLRQAVAQEPDLLPDLQQALNEDGNVLIYTNHGNLADVAIVMAALQCELDEPALVQGSRIFVGPIMKELAIRDKPAIGALQKAAGTLVAFPYTQNTVDRVASGEFAQEVVDQTNGKMLKEFVSQARAGKIRLLATAPSGTTEKVENGQIIMQSISAATAKISERYFDALLPCAIAMGEKGVGIKLGRLQRLHQGVSVHDVMEQQLAPMYQELVGQRVIYQRPEVARKDKNGRKFGRQALDAT